MDAIPERPQLLLLEIRIQIIALCLAGIFRQRNLRDLNAESIGRYICKQNRPLISLEGGVNVPAASAS
jgi:hypothetical protein